MTGTLHIITGPTAVGKTAYALDYAERIGAEIVSCDASLFYRGMDIGTAKPTREERARVPHHLIDIVPVDMPFDIAAFEKAARELIAEIRKRGKGVVITGGSGFYLKSFFQSIVDDVEVSRSVKEGVAELYREAGLEGLLAELRRASPEGLGNLDTLNPRRVQRALERCLASGKSLIELQAEFAARPEPYPNLEKYLIVLERDTADLHERVARRAEAMLESGLVDEVRRLQAGGIEHNPSAATAIGYRETLAYLHGDLAQEDLLPAIIQNTKRLIKKQRTWLRTQIKSPEKKIAL